MCHERTHDHRASWTGEDPDWDDPAYIASIDQLEATASSALKFMVAAIARAPEMGRAEMFTRLMRQCCQSDVDPAKVAAMLIEAMFIMTGVSSTCVCGQCDQDLGDIGSPEQ